MTNVQEELALERRIEKIIDSYYYQEVDDKAELAERRKETLAQARNECLVWLSKEIIPRLEVLPTDEELTQLGSIIASKWPILASGVARVDLTHLRQVALHDTESILRVYVLALVNEVNRVLSKTYDPTLCHKGQ